MTTRKVIIAILAAVVAGVVGIPSIAHADAAGPTDYRTDIVSVTPSSALDSIEVSIIGGDAFVQVTVQPGHELIVRGYLPDEEPYLRIRPDGVIEENGRSFATYYNQNRYGTADIPDAVDTTADPDWEQIAEGRTWAWHDHRAHWMGSEPLINLDPGDSLPPERIPLVLDGEPVEVEVVTTYLPAPSSWPSLVGVLVGVQLGLLGVWLGRASAVLVALLIAGIALWAGLAQFLSLPASTGPLLTWWLLPAVALVSSAAVIAIYGRSIWVETGLVAIAALQLMVWSWQRRDHLTRAFVSTDMPQGLDRAITTAVFVGAGALLVGAFWQLWRATATPDHGA